MVKYVQGSIFGKNEEVILHGCNCSGGFGSGFAAEIAMRYPKTKAYYHHHYDEGSIVLGDIQCISNWDNVIIINAFTQEKYGIPENGPYVNYPALRSCFEKALARFDSLACPKVGAGLAGGNWDIIERIINEVSQKKEVRVYYL